MKVSAISVDLDSLQHYCRIQGVPESVLDDRARSLVDAVAVPRYLELFDKAGVPATFFAIGAEAGPGLRRAREAGVEIASHSFAHDYAMSRWPADRIEHDLDAAHTAITEASGEPPVGFRAPGYTLSPALLRAVARKGYAYDSSAYPAAPYWLAKAGVMGALRALGRPSRAETAARARVGPARHGAWTERGPAPRRMDIRLTPEERGADAPRATGWTRGCK